MKKKYQVFIKLYGNTYCNYYANKKDLKSAIDYFVNDRKCDLEQDIQVSLNIKGKWYIMSTNELLKCIGGIYE